MRACARMSSYPIESEVHDRAPTEICLCDCASCNNYVTTFANNEISFLLQRQLILVLVGRWQLKFNSAPEFKSAPEVHIATGVSIGTGSSSRNRSFNQHRKFIWQYGKLNFISAPEVHLGTGISIWQTKFHIGTSFASTPEVCIGTGVSPGSDGLFSAEVQMHEKEVGESIKEKRPF